MRRRFLPRQDSVTPVRVLRHFTVALCALLAVGLGVPTIASAEWTAPFGLSDSRASDPQVGVDADGDAVFGWTTFDGTNDRVQVAARSADGALSAVQTLGRPGQDSGFPRLAVDADGDAVIGWSRYDGLNGYAEAQARRSDGTLSRVLTIPNSAGQFAVDADGNAVFALFGFDGANRRAQTVTRSASGVLSSVQTLSEPGQDASHLSVAVAADGDAVFTWLRSDGTHQRVQAIARSAAGVLSRVYTLSAARQDAAHPQVAVDADGDAVITWQRREGETDRAQVRALSAGGALSAVQNLSDRGQHAREPRVAVDADGDAVFTWSVVAKGESYVSRLVQARARSAAGVLSAVQDISRPEGSSVPSRWETIDPQVGIDADGDAVFIWQRFDRTDFWVQARTRSADGSLGAVEDLSSPGPGNREPDLAVGAEGDAVVTWIYGSPGRIQASAGP